MDVFTPPYNDERSEQSRWFELDEAPRAGSEDLFEAKIT